MVKLELTPSDKISGLWQRLKVHFEERITDVRKTNDLPQSEEATAMLRGEIKCLKGLIALGLDRPLTDRDEQPPTPPWASAGY